MVKPACCMRCRALCGSRLRRCAVLRRASAVPAALGGAGCRGGVAAPAALPAAPRHLAGWWPGQPVGVKGGRRGGGGPITAAQQEHNSQHSVWVTPQQQMGVCNQKPTTALRGAGVLTCCCLLDQPSGSYLLVAAAPCCCCCCSLPPSLLLLSKSPPLLCCWLVLQLSLCLMKSSDILVKSDTPKRYSPRHRQS